MEFKLFFFSIGYKTENNILNANLAVIQKDLSHCKKNLSDCERTKNQLDEKLKSSESELKQKLGRIRQLKLQTKTCNKDKDKDKLACITDNNNLNEDLTAKFNEVSRCERSLSGCETKKSSINREKSNLVTKLKSKESELSKTLGEKKTCLREKDLKNKALEEKSGQLWNVNIILNNCRSDFKECFFVLFVKRILIHIIFEYK